MAELDLDDIQGKVLAGFNTDSELFVGLSAQADAVWADIANWASSLSEEVTSTADVKATREAMKSPVDGVGLTWLFVALGNALFAKTQTDVTFIDRAFRRGMRDRAGPLLDDRIPADEWAVGGKQPVDMLLVIASNDLGAARQRADELALRAGQVGLVETYREAGRKIADLEHFGFRDGMSQPVIAGYDPEGALAAGEFIFGQPRSLGGPIAKVGKDERGVTHNGSLMVFRRLAQDVLRFREFCAAEAARIAGQWPGFSGEHLQALIVGRWPEGALVSMEHDADPGPPADGHVFDFADDRQGLLCPTGSHIRKVNPRLGDRDVVDVPRLLRRGIPFGPPYDEDPAAERGLLFVCFQTSIEQSFEFITASWMNTSNRPASNAGHDMLVGRSHVPKTFMLQSPHGDIQVSDGGQQWITPTGGAYLFAPSRSGLRKLAGTPMPTVSTRISRFATQIADALASY